MFSSTRNLYKLLKIRNIVPAIRHPRVLLRNSNILKTFKLCHVAVQDLKSPNEFTKNKILLALSILAWLGFADEDENKESELITTLKRAVLCTQREQYDKAEQMLHLALRLAQQQQNKQGVLYCYDLMANLALDTFQLEKAEKLFVTVLQMLLSSGMEQDDLKVIHISLKLARISHLRADTEKAELGYRWCLDNIEKHKKRSEPSEDAKMLDGVIQDWYAQFLLDLGRNSDSLRYLKTAHKVCSETNGLNSEQSMLLLNDLGITCFRAGDLESAQSYLSEAVEIGNVIENKVHVGIVHANLGLIMLEKGIVKEAEKHCKQAWYLGKKHENNESMEQANYCFDQIKLNLKK